MKKQILGAVCALALISPLRSAEEGHFNWPDRRPIGALFLAASGKNWPKNPRGYFNDPNLDVNTPEGQAELRRRMMTYAENAIAQVKDVGGQGVVVWDIEGGEMPHAVTYLGDPRVLPRVAPEMDAIADEFFAKFKEAGLISGICIRPTSIVFKDEGDYPWIKARFGHADSEDPVGVLADKIAYAKKRWGCTNFYVDTNYTPLRENGKMVRKKDGSPTFRMLTGAEMAELRSRHPDVLIWPEFQQPDYFASVSGYGEYFRVSKITELAIVDYPKAFRIWMPRLQAFDIYRSWEEFLTQGFLKGEVFLFEPSATTAAISPIARALKNAGIEAAHRAKPGSFQPAASVEARIAQLESSQNWAHRRVLVELLAGESSPAATAALERVLGGSTDGLEWFAGMALARQGTEAALAALKKASSRESSAQLPAVQGLGFSGRKETVPVLIPYLAPANKPELKWMTLDALTRLGDPAAVPAIVAYMETLKGTAANRSRDLSITALEKIGGPAARTALQAAAKDPEYAPLHKRIATALEAAPGTGKTGSP